MTVSSLCLLVATLCSVQGALGASYFPPYVQGKPAALSVVALKEADYRGQPVYQIDFTVSHIASYS